jgi:two-component system NtrC family sensor kinase
VLGIISSSPGELMPVFETILANATRICGAKFGALCLSEGNAFRMVAIHGVEPALREKLQHLRRPAPGLAIEPRVPQNCTRT